jgi:glutaryl-CoA dehydrogenase
MNIEQKTAAASFVWSDPFLIEDQLSEDERMLRDAAAAFASDKLAPRIEEAYLTEKTDPAIFREMGELGLLGITIEGMAAPASSYVAYGLVAREVERVDSGYRSMMSVQSSLVMHPIHSLRHRGAARRNTCPSSPPANGSAASA